MLSGKSSAFKPTQFSSLNPFQKRIQDWIVIIITPIISKTRMYPYTIEGYHDHNNFPMKNHLFYTVSHHFHTPTGPILHGNQAVTGIDINLLEDFEGPPAI